MYLSLGLPAKTINAHQLPTNDMLEPNIMIEPFR
jgi:hypothetical protein